MIANKMFYKLLTITRYIQFIILLIIIGLEIAQLLAFRANREQFSFPNVNNSAPLSSDGNVSWSVYFEDMNIVHGIKIFYYIVIILTLLGPPKFPWKCNTAKNPIISNLLFTLCKLRLLDIMLALLNPIILFWLGWACLLDWDEIWFDYFEKLKSKLLNNNNKVEYTSI
ncbi:unnamed protein product [Rhizophagus irregularis]|nr:unnamed protein product [Rhizophagus irregularis]